MKIKRIFFKYWLSFRKSHNVRDSVCFNISRFLKCGDYRYGYISHPPISENRITDINEEKNTVTYYYTPHEDETKTITVTEDIFEFIKKLIIHIPEKGFKQIRYYGLYASAYKKRKITYYRKENVEEEDNLEF